MHMNTSKPQASYDYLLSMALWSLTEEKVSALQEEADTSEAEVGRRCTARLAYLHSLEIGSDTISCSLLPA